VTVTVCVPVWNGEAFVEQTLESVRGQTLDDITVLISVDKSDDQSLEICRAVATKDPRFRVFAQSARLGWIANVNWLLRQVNSEFANVLPHDDVITPVYLERLIAKLDSHPEAVLAFCDMQTFGNRDAVRVGPEATGDLFERILNFLYENTAAEAWRGVFRSKVLKQGYYLEEVNGTAADQVWLLRLVVHGHFVRVPEILYRKRLHKDSIVAKSYNENGLPTDSHWADHCVSCHRLALAAGQWTDTQKQAIAAACLTRALSRPVNSMTSLLTSAADYAQRLSGLARPGSDLMRPTDFSDKHRTYFERSLWRLLARKAVRIFLPARRPRE